MNSKTALFALCLSAFFLAGGCRTSKLPPAAGTEAAGRMDTEEAFFLSVREQSFRYETLSARMQVEWTMPEKTFSSRASLKIRKNERMQLSLQPLLGIEAFRLDITPDSIWIIDRLNKRYLAENFSRLKDAFRVEFNFYNLQALFTNQLFLPGEMELPEKAFTRFRRQPAADNGYKLQTKGASRWQYSFTTGGDRKLYASRITDTVSEQALLWDYADFRPVGTQFFPMKVQAGWIDGEETKSALSMKYSQVDTDVPVEIKPVIPAGYERVSLSQVRKMFEQP